MSSRIIRIRECCHLCGLSRSSILRLERKGQFPPKLNLGLHAIGWYEAAVQEWIQARAVPASRAPVRP
jgi:prophage regulatory protein